MQNNKGEDINQLKQNIKQMESELNQLRLQETNACFKIMLSNLSNKEKITLIQEISNALNIEFEIRKSLWVLKKAVCYSEDDDKGFWTIEINEFGIRYYSGKCFNHTAVKSEIKILVNIAKKYMKKDYLGICNLNGLKVPEFEQSGIPLIYV